jgi:hypothetical protein
LGYFLFGGFRALRQRPVPDLATAIGRTQTDRFGL